MERPPFLRTPRLLLRRWQEADREPFAALNADPRVMEHFVAPLTRTASDAAIDRIEQGFEREGYGLWAVQVLDAGVFVGFTGLARPMFDAPFQPAIEIGWRLAAEHWGRGYATEAARAAAAFAFEVLRVEEIVSFTAPANLRSRRVMERLGMRHDPAGDFDHPNVPESHRLRRHVLYRLGREQWRTQPGADLSSAP